MFQSNSKRLCLSITLVLLTKIALTHAGDITPKPVEHHRKTMAEVFADDIDEDDAK
jgi:hypothetical protein